VPSAAAGRMTNRRSSGEAAINHQPTAPTATSTFLPRHCFFPCSELPLAAHSGYSAINHQRPVQPPTTTI